MFVESVANSKIIINSLLKRIATITINVNKLVWADAPVKRKWPGLILLIVFTFTHGLNHRN